MHNLFLHTLANLQEGQSCKTRWLWPSRLNQDVFLTCKPHPNRWQSKINVRLSEWCLSSISEGTDLGMHARHMQKNQVVHARVHTPLFPHTHASLRTYMYVAVHELLHATSYSYSYGLQNNVRRMVCAAICLRAILIPWNLFFLCLCYCYEKQCMSHIS